MNPTLPSNIVKDLQALKDRSIRYLETTIEVRENEVSSLRTMLREKDELIFDMLAYMNKITIPSIKPDPEVSISAPMIEERISKLIKASTLEDELIKTFNTLFFKKYMMTSSQNRFRFCLHDDGSHITLLDIEKSWIPQKIYSPVNFLDHEGLINSLRDEKDDNAISKRNEETYRCLSTILSCVYSDVNVVITNGVICFIGYSDAANAYYRLLDDCIKKYSICRLLNLYPELKDAPIWKISIPTINLLQKHMFKE